MFLVIFENKICRYSVEHVNLFLDKTPTFLLLLLK